MKRFDVLSRELNVFGERILEASAGTGKTFAIEHIVLRLIIDSVRPLTLEQILVVTFTRAATRELKMRIRANLEVARSELEARNARFDYLQAVIERGEEAILAALRRLDAALSTFDQAQIFTIHSFCYRMLREFAFEAKVPFDLVDPDEREHTELMREGIYDFFRARLSLPEYGLSQVEALLFKHKSDLKRLAKRLLSILERRVAPAPAPNFRELHAQFSARLKELPEVSHEKLVHDLHQLAPHYKKFDVARAEKQLRFFSKRSCSEHEFDMLLREKESVLEHLQQENLKKRAKLPGASELHYPDIFEKLSKALLPIVKVAQDPLLTLMRLARDCSAEKNFTALSFDALLEKMLQTLQLPSFCEKIRTRYEALIVDEFQDTDPTQWKIFQTLFLKTKKSPAALYLVGDPKQSIYRFRGADVYTYLDAAEKICERACLDTNFRSGAPLVQALNRLFSFQAAGRWLTLPTKESALAFEPVQHKKEESETQLSDAKGAVHFFLAQDKKGRERSWPNTKLEREKFFPFIANEILRLQRAQGLSYKQFAVLVKDRFQALRLHNFLKGCNIPSSVSRGKSLVDLRGYAVMVELVDALVDPGKIKVVLAGPLFNLSHEELRGVEFDFDALLEKWKRVSFGAMWKDLLALSWGGQTVLERILAERDLYHELTQVAELLMAEEAAGPVSIEKLRLFLRGLKAEGANEEEATIVHAPAVQDEVALMTVHMSKGLEFEVVFALAVASRHLNQEELIVVRNGTHEKLEKLKPDDTASCLYLQEQDAEKMRQFYVALTRAKRRVYIPMAFEAEAPDVKLGEQAPVELFFADKNRMEDVVACLATLDINYDILDTVQGVQPQAIQEMAVEPAISSELVVPESKRYLLSFSSLARKAEQEERIELSSDTKSVHTLPLGAETGSVLHLILEKIFKKRLFSPQHCAERVELIQAELRRSHLKEWEEIVTTLIEETLALPLTCADVEIRLCELSASKIATEMEFLFPVGKNLIKGFADLFFEWNGKYYLVDWKSNWLGSDDAAYARQNLEKAMHEHDYFLQGAIYAAAFERYVKLFDKRPFPTLFGGAFYIFLRGRIPYHFLPDIKEEWRKLERV